MIRYLIHTCSLSLCSSKTHTNYYLRSLQLFFRFALLPCSPCSSKFFSGRHGSGDEKSQPLRVTETWVGAQDGILLSSVQSDLQYVLEVQPDARSMVG